MDRFFSVPPFCSLARVCFHRPSLSSLRSSLFGLHASDSSRGLELALISLASASLGLSAPSTLHSLVPAATGTQAPSASNAMAAQSSTLLPQLSLQSHAASLTSLLLRPSSLTAATQQINIEALQMLKERMSGTAASSSGSGAGGSAAPASSTASSASSGVAELSSMTWGLFVRTLPPSGNASSSPDVVALRRAFADFLAATAALVDDERSGAALAETAAVIYRACALQQTREDSATAASQAAAASTSSGADNLSASAAAAPSAELLAQLKSIAAGVRAEVVKHVGRVGEIQWKKCQTIARDMRKQVVDMQAKYDKARLLRELNRMPPAGSGSSSSADKEPGTLFIPAPRSSDESIPCDPLLAEEFGADLPLMLAGSDDGDEGALDDQDDDEDSPLQAASDLASKPVRAIMRQLRESMHKMGLRPDSAAASSSSAAAAASAAATATAAVSAAPAPGSGSILGLTPNAVPAPSEAEDSEADSASALSDSDYSSEDLYAGESEEDEQERVAQQVASLQAQQVRAMHESKPSPYSVASLPAGSVPSNPAQWWSYLVQQCERFVTYSDTGIPLVTNQEVSQQVLAILQSNKADVQNDLVDLLGFDALDLLELLVAYRKEIKQITSQHQAQARQSKAEREQQASEQTRKAPDGSVIRGLVGISIQTSTDIEQAKNRKRADRRHARRSAREAGDGAVIGGGAPSKTFIDEAKLDAQASSLKSWINSNSAQSVSQLPPGTTRERFTKPCGYEQVCIPPPPTKEVVESDLRTIAESFEPFMQQAFPKTKTLNRIQSKVYESAYHHNNNLLICAPTGAGQ